ncbi:ATP-dependent RNA helicase RhlB (EC [Olavius sp. associated proteobacterium Delta 1]|nr:ATP-dependent RNA helicase RhlB (EC [Olavius sp. associated proteobacterium Delta 1]
MIRRMIKLCFRLGVKHISQHKKVSMSMPEESQSLLQPPRAPKPEFLTETRFDEFNLPAEVLAGLKDAGFVHCTPIQAQTLPVSLTGRDVAGQAQTGTGKTAAFLVTVLNGLLADSVKSDGLPLALVVAPTRELSQQIYEEAKVLCRHTRLTLAQVVGGVDYVKQADILRAGVDIVICTPGRIIDYYKQKIFKTEGIKALVIDEADRLLDLGFAKDMRYILRKLPTYDKRQSMLFSATLSYRVMELTYEYMNLPEFISVTPQTVTVEGIEQSLFHVGIDKKIPLLLGLLKREEWNRMLIFVNTKSGVDYLTYKLKGNGWPAEGITGDLPQRKRFQLMAQYKKGQIKILVATDVASRGIHVEDISHVINYDLPQDSENYVHRIGRTARAGKTGIAISLACEKYVFHLEPLEKMLEYKIPVVWPEEDWYLEDRSKPFPAKRKARLKSSAQRRNRSAENKKRVQRKPQTKRKPSHFPGAFFGFGPQPVETKPGQQEIIVDPEEIIVDPEETKVEPGETKAQSAAQNQKPAEKKKRAPRKRKRPAAKAPQANIPKSSDV